MLNFDFFNHRAEVRKALTSRMNHQCMDGLRHQDRQLERSNFAEVVWLVPLDGKQAEFGKAVPAVSKDISVQGLCLIHTAPLSDAEMVVGVPGQHGVNFFHCKVEHCSSMGYGYYQIGLFPSKVLKLSMSQLMTWESRQAEFAEAPLA